MTSFPANAILSSIIQSYRKQRPLIPLPKINGQITATELLVIDEHDANVGKLSRESALRLAQEKGLDLIEVSPNAQPPVARIISFDKYRYQQEKKIKKQRASQKSNELKQVQISAREAQNDLSMKIKRIDGFLADGNAVEIMLVLRGREKYNRDWSQKKMNDFRAMLPPHKMINEPKSSFKGMIMMIGPNK